MLASFSYLLACMPYAYVTILRTTTEIYQEILGFRFEEVEKPYVWHEDVQLFSVYDKDSNDFIGHFYLDLYPRDGKRPFLRQPSSHCLRFL